MAKSKKCPLCGMQETHHFLTPYSISLQDNLKVEYRIRKVGGAWKSWKIGTVEVEEYRGLKGKQAKYNSMPAQVQIKEDEDTWDKYPTGLATMPWGKSDCYDEDRDEWKNAEDDRMQIRETLNAAPPALVDAVIAVTRRFKL